MKRKSMSSNLSTKCVRELRGSRGQTSVHTRSRNAKVGACGKIAKMKKKNRKNASFPMTRNNEDQKFRKKRAEKVLQKQEQEDKKQVKEFSLMIEILIRLKQKVQRVHAENRICSKYLSKKVFQKIMGEEDAGKLRLNQDQKKSLECNLIYNILKYMEWSKLIDYFRRNRTKVKTLKVSRFKEYIIDGKLFQEEKEQGLYKVTAEMLESAVVKLRDSNSLLRQLFEKKAYRKLFQDSIEKYKEKMTVFVYKIHQFTQLINREQENSCKGAAEGMQTSVKMGSQKEETNDQSRLSREGRYSDDEYECRPDMERTPLDLELEQPIPLMAYFNCEIIQTEMQNRSIFQDIRQEIYSQENSYTNSFQMI